MEERRPRGAEAPLIAGAAMALFALALAHGSETFLGLKPCELCLAQRNIYWATAAAGVVLAIVVRARPGVGVAALLILAAFFVAEAAAAAYHAGVEWRWWPGPTRCTGAGAHHLTTADMQALLSGTKEKVVQCDVAAIRILGVSMAGWNALLAAALALASLLAARRWSRPR